jgi:HAD superfamily hydrolase (TIGR01549 family)
MHFRIIIVTTKYISAKVSVNQVSSLKEPKPLPIDAVIFDLDGTLANFNLDFKTLRSEVRSYLMRIGVPTSLLNVNESIFEMLTKTEIFTKNSSKHAVPFEEVRRQVMAIAEKYEMEAASATSLMPGTNETLKELNKMNMKIGLCTTSSEKAANFILKRFKIVDFFQIVIARDKVKYVKPNTEPFEVALKGLDANPQTVVIVGDSLVDMQSAKELKIIAVGLTTGVSKMEQLKNNGANYIITSLTDLPTLIKKINES